MPLTKSLRLGTASFPLPFPLRPWWRFWRFLPANELQRQACEPQTLHFPCPPILPPKKVKMPQPARRPCLFENMAAPMASLEGKKGWFCRGSHPFSMPVTHLVTKRGIAVPPRRLPAAAGGNGLYGRALPTLFLDAPLSGMPKAARQALTVPRASRRARLARACPPGPLRGPGP